MPYRDEPRPIATTHDRIARALALLAGCALVFPVAGLVFALLPEPLFSPSPVATVVTWVMRASFLALGIAGVLLSRSLEGRARNAALGGGIVVAIWAIAIGLLQTLDSLRQDSLQTFIVLHGIASLLGDAGILAIVYAVGEIRQHARVHDPGLALRAAVAAVGGTFLQSLVWTTRAKGAPAPDYWNSDLSLLQLFFRIDNLFWTAPFLLLAIGALQRRRLGSIAPLETKVEDDVVAPSSRTASRAEAVAMFGVARVLVAAGAVTAIAIGVPSLLLLLATVLTGKPVPVNAAARTLVFPHGAVLTALGMAFYATRGPEAREASSGARLFLLVTMLGVALADLVYFAGDSLGVASSWDADSVYAAWAFTAALASVALSTVLVDVHQRARVAIVHRSSDSDEIPSFARGTDSVMRTASIAAGVAALSTACGHCATTRSSTTTALWVIAAVAAVAATIAAATAAKRARRLADRLESFRL